MLNATFLWFSNTVRNILWFFTLQSFFVHNSDSLTHRLNVWSWKKLSFECSSRWAWALLENCWRPRSRTYTHYSFFKVSILLHINVRRQAVTQCLKIIGKVSFNNSSEASYFCVLSGQKFIKNVKNGPFWWVFENATHWVIFKHCATWYTTESWGDLEKE